MLPSTIFTLLECNNFETYPMGGTLSFDKQILKVFGNKISLVGYVRDQEPIGEWFLKEINGVEFYFFGIGYTSKLKQTKLPHRIASYFALRKYLKKIHSTSNKIIFTQAPQFVFALKNFKWKSFCFCFAGLSNSLSISKFALVKYISKTYESLLFQYLRINAKVILAAADNPTIENKCEKFKIRSGRIKSFPTRFDDSIFKPRCISDCRDKLGIHQNELVLVTTGRLSNVKGWKFLIDSLLHLNKSGQKHKLVFIGEGEARVEIEKYVAGNSLQDQVLLTGRLEQQQIAEYLSAASLFVMGSVTEGWPTAMVEALACGKTVVSTDVSGAKDMVHDGKNGFVVNSRSSIEFADSCMKALALPILNEHSIILAKRFSVSRLKDDFFSKWLNGIQDERID